MNGAGMGLRRMVVGLPQGRAEESAFHLAADLAEFLQIEFLAAFIADATLHELAGLSGARELRASDYGWQAIDVAQIAREIESAAGIARRRFTEAVKARTIKASFDVISGGDVTALIRADDIVAIIEPAHPGERITRQFTGLMEVAFAQAGAVLVVPRRIARTAGPIVAEAADLDDPSIRAALQIAAALKERLIIVSSAATRLPADLLAEAERLGVAIEQIASALPMDAMMLPPIRLEGRLRVLPRQLLSDDAYRLFSSLRGIPLLALESDRAKTAA